MVEHSYPWNQTGWLDDARLWIIATLDAIDIQVVGEMEHFHVRPWSTLLRVPTNDGLVYFKASAPVLAYEPALTFFLAQFRPHIMPDILAVDLQRGWMLMRDSGTQLRVFIKTERSLKRWQDILPLYVELQKELASHTGQLLSLGILDRRLETLPEQFEQLVADEPAMLIGQPDGLTSEEYARLRASTSYFGRMCSELASFGIPDTIHHDDFHDGNVFLQNDHVRFTDWGESAVTHPFFSLTVLLRSGSNSLDLEPDDPQLVELRDWYLSHWTNYAPLSGLQPVVHLAQRVGLVNRALTWHRVISYLPESVKSEYAMAVPDYLKEFITTE